MDSLVKVQYGNLILLTFNAPWVPAPATRPPPLTNPVLAAGKQEGGAACVPKHALIVLLCILLPFLSTTAKTIIQGLSALNKHKLPYDFQQQHTPERGCLRRRVALCPWCYLPDCAQISIPADISLPRRVPAAHLQLRSAWHGTARMNCFWMFPLQIGCNYKLKEV